MNNEEEKDVKKEEKVENTSVENKKEEVKKENQIKAEGKKASTKSNKADKKTEKSEKTKEPTEKKSNKNKIILFSSIGVVALVVVGLIIALVVNLTSKPSKNTATEFVRSYIDAINDKDKGDLVELIDTEGYMVFGEYGEKKFNSKIKDKSKSVKKCLEKNKLDDIDEADEFIAKKIISETNGSYLSREYTFKEITSISKSKKSSKIVVIKAKVKVEYSSKSDTKVLRLYTTKVNGKFKVVGYELV